MSYRSKLMQVAQDAPVESCRPNPCLNGGRCLSNGDKSSCQCFGHFTGNTHITFFRGAPGIRSRSTSIHSFYKLCPQNNRIIWYFVSLLLASLFFLHSRCNQQSQTSHSLKSRINYSLDVL